MCWKRRWAVRNVNAWEIADALPKLRSISYRSSAMMGGEPLPCTPVECATWTTCVGPDGTKRLDFDPSPEAALDCFYRYMADYLGDAEHIQFLIWPECYTLDLQTDIWRNTGLPEWRVYARFMVMPNA